MQANSPPGLIAFATPKKKRVEWRFPAASALLAARRRNSSTSGPMRPTRLNIFQMSCFSPLPACRMGMCFWVTIKIAHTPCWSMQNALSMSIVQSPTEHMTAESLRQPAFLPEKRITLLLRSKAAAAYLTQRKSKIAMLIQLYATQQDFSRHTQSFSLMDSYRITKRSLPSLPSK